MNGANLNDSKLPLTLGLRIGNDVGKTTLKNSRVVGQTE